MKDLFPSPLVRSGAVLGVGSLVLALSMTALASTHPSRVETSDATDSSVLEAYAVLAGSSVTSIGATILNADLAVSPGLTVTGFPPGIVNGLSHVNDSAATAAQLELTSVYDSLASRAPDGAIPAELGGATLSPGTYAVSGAASVAGSLTLDAGGDADAEFIVQVGTSLSTGAGSTVLLSNGAQACNVFWQVGDSAALGATSSFVGSILAAGSIALGTHSGLDGRALARTGSVTLSSNTIVQSNCVGGFHTPPGETESPTPSDSPTQSESPTETPTPSDSPTQSESPTETPTPSDSPTQTDSPTETPTPSDSPTQTGSPTETPTPSDSPTEPPADAQPNIVFVLVDDLSENLLPYMTQVQALAADGVRFENFYASTPWCCPSRATYQSGKYPHNTGVLTNNYPKGGFENFLVGDMDTSIGVQMQQNGYRTGFMGKYLNGYQPRGQQRLDDPFYPPNFIPPGWNDWYSGASGYQEFKYSAVKSTDNSPPVNVVMKGSNASNYYTDVLSTNAQAFITADHDEPFFLMLTPFAPHNASGDPQGGAIKYPPAPRDRAPSVNAPKKWHPEFSNGDCGVVDCADVPWPDTTTPGNFNTLTTNPLGWMSSGLLDARQLAKLKSYHLQRIQMMQSVNDMLAAIRQKLADTGQADNTYIVFGSDNGYHLGEHALYAGKTTAFDHDVRTPLIVHPPGGTGAPITVNEIVQNTDVFPTLVELAGGTPGPDVDGLSMLPLVGHGDVPWRANALLELTNDKHDDMRYANPDTRGYEGDHVAPTYNAIRSEQYLYVDYSVMDGLAPGDNEAEFYDLATDPYETNNRYAELTPEQRLALNTELASQVGCVGAACWDAQTAVPDVALPPPP